MKLSGAPREEMDRVRILIVEDEALVARDTENMLLHFGYEVLGLVRTGEEAVTKKGINRQGRKMDKAIRGQRRSAK